MDQDLQQASNIRDGDIESIDMLKSLFVVSIISLVDLLDGTTSAFFCAAILLTTCKPDLIPGSDFMHKAEELSRVKMAIDFLVDLHSMGKSCSSLENVSISRDNRLVISSHRENDKPKTFSRWRPVSLLFKFLHKIRECCKEAKKDDAIAAFRPPITNNQHKGEYLGGGSLGAPYTAFAVHHRGRRDNQLTLCSLEEDQKRKRVNKWRTVSLLFKFLYRIRKHFEETRKDHAVFPFRNKVQVYRPIRRMPQLYTSQCFYLRQPIIMDWQKFECLGGGAIGAAYKAFAAHDWIRRGNQLAICSPRSYNPFMPSHEESESVKNRWKTISLLFQFLFKVRKCCQEAKKDHRVSTSRPHVIKKWQKGPELGRGAFGAVYEAFTDNSVFFALKEVLLDNEDRQHHENVSHAEQEISLLTQFQHENIVCYYGSQKDDSKFFIFLELVSHGSLAQLYKTYCLSDPQVSTYTKHILRGLSYLHSQNVIHRDIKCANALVDANGSVKLADFGLAKVIKQNDTNSIKGSPYWMAPEAVNPKKHGSYGTAADIWSLGCTVLEMLTRKIPYSDLDKCQAIFRIGQGKAPPIPDNISSSSRDFILKCLQANPNNRPTAAQLLKHPFVNQPPSSFPT